MSVFSFIGSFPLEFIQQERGCGTRSQPACYALTRGDGLCSVGGRMKLNAAACFLCLLSLGTMAHASDEEAVRSRDDQERIAALRRDVSALEDLWSADFTVNAPNNRVIV